jgi:HlyD family secretion protein
MKYIKNKWFIMAILLATIAALTAFKFESGKAPQYYTQKVQQGDIQNVVQATGSITAVTTVQVGSQVSGTIKKLYVDFNSHVTKGQVIAEIDPALFQGTLLQAKADLQDARANLEAAKANLEKAQAAETQTHLDYTRNDELAKAGVVPAQQLDAAKAAWQSAVAAVSAAKAQVTQAAAQEQQKAAAVTVAQTNLDYTVIKSPIDGTVVARSVDVGQTVAASLQAPTLFTIAQDLTKMQVYVSTDESDVGAIHIGQPATFKVDAFPNENFTGRVSQVRLNATTVQNVVTYTTVVDFDNPQMKLFPGMTAYVNIPVAQAENVLKVPNGALRFKPQTASGQSQRQFSGSGRQAKDSTVGTIWKQGADKSLQPVQVKLGITDHTFTQVAQVLSGSLNSGDQVAIGSATSSQQKQGPTGAPGVGGAPRGMGGLGR